MNETTSGADDQNSTNVRGALGEHSSNGDDSRVRQNATSPPLVPGGPKTRPVAQLPGIDCDILRGIAMIAMWLGISEGQCREDIRKGLIPVHRFGPGKGTVYAFKSEILLMYREALGRT